MRLYVGSSPEVCAHTGVTPTRSMILNIRRISKCAIMTILDPGDDAPPITAPVQVLFSHHYEEDDKGVNRWANLRRKLIPTALHSADEISPKTHILSP